MPWLNGISLPCLASIHAPHHIRQTISKIFGGAAPNQGLGFLAISLDTQYVSFGQFGESAACYEMRASPATDHFVSYLRSWLPIEVVSRKRV